MESNYIELRDGVDRAQTVLTNSERTLEGLKAQSVDLASQLDACGVALAEARAERARTPTAPHLSAAVSTAASQFDSFSDASEACLRSTENAMSVVAQARATLASAERDFEPAKLEHDQQMQAAHNERREAFEKALPSARKLVALFGDGAVEAFASIVKAGCTQPMPEKFPAYPGPGSIFAQIAAHAARIQ